MQTLVSSGAKYVLSAEPYSDRLCFVSFIPAESADIVNTAKDREKRVMNKINGFFEFIECLYYESAYPCNILT